MMFANGEENKMAEQTFKEEIENEADYSNSYEFLDVVLDEQGDNVNVEKSNKTSSCDQCESLSGHSSTGDTNTNCIHTGIAFICEQCGYPAETSSQLNSHVESEHSGKIYKCDDCDYRVATKDNLRIHRHNKHLNIRYDCNFCDFQTPYRHNLKKHVKVKHTDDEERQKHLKKCPLCDFTTLWSLKKHIKSVHREGELIVRCHWDSCDYETNNKPSLYEHIRAIHEAEQFKCDHCDAEFKLKSGLKVHLESAHLDIIFPCGQCDYKATCRKYMKDHMRRSHGNTYPCEFCEYVAKRTSLLKKHLKSQHKVEISNAKIESDISDPVENHEMVDSFQPPNKSSHASLDQRVSQLMTKTMLGWNCNECPYSTRDKYHMKEHAETHIEGYVHQCEYCEKTFGKRASLRQHLRKCSSKQINEASSIESHSST